MVYSTRRFVVCLSVCHFVFFSPFSIAVISLGEERANLSAFRTFVRFVLVWICRFPFPLGVWEGLRFVIVALPGLFSCPFFLLLLLLYSYNINGAGQVQASAFSPEKRKLIKCHDTFNFVILILISHAKCAESLIKFWTEVKMLKLLSSGRSSFPLSKVLMFRGWNCLVLLKKQFFEPQNVYIKKCSALSTFLRKSHR